jgi:REP element-mobilizing transposase RayT
MLYKNKYRIDSIRLQNHDYSSAGMYFVTICTHLKEHYFGEIKNNEIFHSPIGKMAELFWQKIPQHFPFVELDEFVVMPNHLHGIIVINERSEIHGQASVETHNHASLQSAAGYKNKFGPQSKNLSSIIRGFKGATKAWATTNNVIFQWQPRFYDHIIRNEKSLTNIREYIRNNPFMWERDRNNVENIFM